MSLMTAILVIFIFLLVIIPYQGRKIDKTLLLLTSFLFYLLMTDVSMMIMLIIVIILNYAFNLVLRRKKNNTLLLFFIAINVLFLGAFKYSDQIINSLFSISDTPDLSSSLTFLIIFPLGISYYTLRNISHLVEVNKRKIKAFNLLEYANYVLFFPQIIAGPIMKPKDFYDGLRGKVKQHHSNTHHLYYFLSGMIKLFFFSILLFPLVEGPFIYPSNYTQIELLIALAAYTTYIYVNFSGYSEISNLTSNLIGFKETPNFDTPYLSVGLSEFWRRWHISLSTWLKDYVYIPLGGNRKSTFRTYLNLFLTMLVSGIWHGATLNFTIWGALHGLWLAIERALRGRFSIHRVVAISLTFIGVSLLWVIFASQDIATAIEYYKILFGFEESVQIAETFNITTAFIVILGLLYIFTEKLTRENILSLRTGLIAIIIVVVTTLIVMFTPGTVPEFIYGGF